jgi:hypothetical protein
MKTALGQILTIVEQTQDISNKLQAPDDPFLHEVQVRVRLRYSNIGMIVAALSSLLQS